jgi:hypothetical protein
VVTNCDILDTLSDRFNDASSFMTKNNGEKALGILSAPSVFVSVANTFGYLLINCCRGEVDGGSLPV